MRGDALVGWLAAWALRALGATWRIRIEGDDPLAAGDREPGIGATWHRNLLIAGYFYRDRGWAIPISRSRDGELISRAVSRLGFAPPLRGSSSRGGAAVLRELLRALRSDVTVCLLTDGPKGPARHSKPGVIAAAAHTGIPVTPAAFSARPCWRFASWDGTLLPWPFARVVCRYGAPLPVPAPVGAGPEQRGDGTSAGLAALDAELNSLQDAVDDALGLVDANRPRDRAVSDAASRRGEALGGGADQAL